MLVLREERSSSFRLSQESDGPGRGTFEGFEEIRQQQEKSSKANTTSVARQVHMWKDCRSKETSAFEASVDGLAETGCIEMASIDLNALEIGAVQLSKKDHRIRIGIASGAAVIVFPKMVADDYPMLHRTGNAKSYRPASGRLLPNLGCAKGASQVQRRVSQVSEPESVGHAQGSGESVNCQHTASLWQVCVTTNIIL